MGLPVVCLDASQAKSVLSLRINKSDPNDAHGLAEIVRSSWYREVQVKSQSAYQLQGLLGARARLVKTKVDLGNQIRGLLRTFSLLVGQAGGKKFDQRVQESLIDEDDLCPPIEALLVCWRRICEQIGVLEKHLYAVARRSPSVRRLMTVPGVGPIVATAYAATIDDRTPLENRAVLARILASPRGATRRASSMMLAGSRNAAISCCVAISSKQPGSC